MDLNANRKEQTLTIRVPGDLLSTNAEALLKEAGGLIDAADRTPQAWKILKLDLTAAKMVDSVGLNLIVTLLKRVQQRGGRMQIAYSSPNIFRTFTFTRLDKHVELVKVSTSQQPPLPEAPNAAPSPRRDLSA